MVLNQIFGSHMVLAANRPLRFFGSGFGTAELSFAEQQVTVTSTGDSWVAELPPMPYGGPYTLTFKSGETTTVLTDIYLGEVYLLAGQSNLQFKMHASATPPEKIQPNPLLRVYTTDRIEKNEPFTAKDGWLSATAENIPNFSAVGYLAGQEISTQKQVAVGLIACYQGASVIESWLPKGALDSIGIQINAEEKNSSHTIKEYSAWNQDGKLYNYQFLKVAPFSLSAVVWYQGESDTNYAEALVYDRELALLIDIWRKDLKNSRLPFAVVQIANYAAAKDNPAWPLVQEAQERVQHQVPFVKTVISKDVCEDDDIHPKTKAALASRLAATLLSFEN